MEDDKDDQYIFGKMLAKVAPNVKLSLFNNGGNLIDALKSPTPKPSVIFIDLNLPGITGHDVMRLIRQNILYTHLPLIAFSASATVWNIEESKQNGADFYIIKAPNLKTYSQALYKALATNWQTVKLSDTDFVFQPA